MRRQVEGQLSLSLFPAERRKPPKYEAPCPIREDCGAYRCETGGCGGERGWCDRARKAGKSPNWDDVQKGEAVLVDVLEPCDRCESSPMKFWRDGRCTHTSEHYAFPMDQGDGMCRRHYIRWKDG